MYPGIFGDGAPKFIYDLGGVSEATVLLDHWVPISKEYDERVIMQESELTADRYFLDRGQYLEISGKIYLFKYDDPLAKFTEIIQYRRKNVILYEHRDKDPFQDSTGNVVLFHIEFIQPKYLTTLDYRDVVYFKFSSLKEVDLIKSTIASVVTEAEESIIMETGGDQILAG